VVHLAFISGMILREGGAPGRGRGKCTYSRLRLSGSETISKARDGSSMYYHPANTPLFKDNLITILDGPTRFYNDLPEPTAVLVLEVEATLQTVSSPNHVSSQWQASNQSRRAYSSQLTYAAWRFVPLPTFCAPMTTHCH
jgi:hypothetical protein